MSTNKKMFDSISQIDGKDLVIELNHNFDSSLNEFRDLTSRNRTLNGVDYPCVYLTYKDYGGLRIQYESGKELCLIVNLEFYYVYGFFLDDSKVYAYKGEAQKALDELGFETETIPYGDGYYDICKEMTPQAYADLKSAKVELVEIISGLDQIVDTSVPFTDKAKSILTVFWSLVEGIRFAGISNVVSSLINEGPKTDAVYNDFYELAEVWAKLSVAAANDKTKNPDIAVYDLHRIK